MQNEVGAPTTCKTSWIDLVSGRATPRFAQVILEWRGTWFLARVALTVTFLASGIAKVVNFSAAVSEQVGYGMPFPVFMAALTMAIELLGSLFILFGRWVWLGAGMLGVFTGLGAVIAHPFWLAPATSRSTESAAFLEHVGLIAGLVLVALVSERSGAIAAVERRGK
jgi:uncharacterized membrane protein YphA (DoxX/SURF4 family)